MSGKVEKGQVYRAKDAPYFQWRVEQVYAASGGPSNCKVVRTDDKYSVKTLSTSALEDPNLFDLVDSK